MEQRDRIHCISLLSCLFIVPLALDGCSSKPIPSGAHYPITSGFHTSLPTVPLRILIWGNPPLTDMAEAWLRSHHYSHLVLPALDPLPVPHASRTSSNRQTVLMLATEMQADVVLLLDQENPTEETLIEPHCGTRSNMSITVHGLLTASHELILRGNAHYPHCVEQNERTVHNLVCQALATAWGFRPSGQLELPSHLACTTGQITPPPTH